jgi:tetratricopeptide (TPR) repeat protein
LSLYETLNDIGGTGDALFRIAEVEHRKGNLPDARAGYERARELFVESGNGRGEMLCIGNLGMLARQQGDHQRAKAFLEDALERARASGERRILGDFIIALAWVNLYLEDLSESNELFERALTEKKLERDRYGICAARHGLATVALKGGRLDEAFEQFKDTVEMARELQLHDYLFRGFYGISAALALKGDAERASKYLRLAERIFRESGRELRDSVAYDVAITSLEAAIPPSEWTSFVAEPDEFDIEAEMSELRRDHYRGGGDFCEM